MPLEQTAATAAPPAMPPLPPPQIKLRINPSPEVQQQVAAAIQACAKWQPEVVDSAKVSPFPPPAPAEAQVCEVLDRWPVALNSELLMAASAGVFLAIAVAVACVAVWAAVRRALAIMSFAPVMRQLTTRTVKGALCGVAVATFWLLLTLPNFATATTEQSVDKAFLFWSSTTPWAAGVVAVLFALDAVPGGWWRQALLAVRPKVASRWSHRED